MAFSKIIVAAIAAFTLATSVSAAPVAKVWDTSKFEAYDVYHTRYNALDCKSKHNTKFFTTCCGPLAHGQSLSSRPAECNPANKSTTDDDTGDDDDDCDDGSDDGDDGDDNVTTLNPTTTTKAAATTTPKAAATTKASTSGSSNTGGKATWYTQDGTTGACGKKHSDSDLIGAMNFHRYGNVDAVSSTCGKKVKITNTANGKEVTITIADACPSCPGKNDIDLSRGAFEKLGAFDTGVLPITWAFTD